MRAADRPLLPRCKPSVTHCVTHRRPLRACRDEAAEILAAERERLRAAVEAKRLVLHHPQAARGLPHDARCDYAYSDMRLACECFVRAAAVLDLLDPKA